MPEENKFGFKFVLANIGTLKKTLPTLLANQAQRHFVSSWSKNGWEGTPWAEVQRRMSFTKAFKYAKPSDRTRHINVKTGALRRATGDCIKEVSFERTVLLVSVPGDYADYINDGTDKMPARPFMKDSELLMEMQIKLIEKQVDKAFNI